MHPDVISIKEYLSKFNDGGYDSPDVKTQIRAGWYDWFCKDTSLRNKTYKLTRYLKQIITSPLINQDTQYVFFKNNCPCVGALYDDFRICDIKTGDVIWTVTPSTGHEVKKGRAELWGKANKFESPIISGTWKDIKSYFLSGGVHPINQLKKEPNGQLILNI